MGLWFDISGTNEITLSVIVKTADAILEKRDLRLALKFNKTIRQSLQINRDILIGNKLPAFPARDDDISVYYDADLSAASPSNASTIRISLPGCAFNPATDSWHRFVKVKDVKQISGLQCERADFCDLNATEMCEDGIKCDIITCSSSAAVRRLALRLDIDLECPDFLQFFKQPYLQLVVTTTLYLKHIFSNEVQKIDSVHAKIRLYNNPELSRLSISSLLSVPVWISLTALSIGILIVILMFTVLYQNGFFKVA